jgi:ABC-2 type transport system ATP-binding protein
VAPAEDQPVLSVRDLAYSYVGASVLRCITFDACAGEVLALIGRNGAGKSTLLRCLAGWSAPAAGQIGFLGRPLRTSARAARRDLVMVPDTPAFYDDLTAREHVRFVLNANRLEAGTAEAERLLGAFGLDAAADAYPSTFSRGMRYKLALVLALMLRPKLLLLDEPFGPLDPVSASELWSEFGEAAAAGAAIILSSHQLPHGALPDRYLVLEHGAIIASGAGAELDQDGTIATLDSVLRGALEREAADDA